MMALPHPNHNTALQTYLQMEAESDIKHEYANSNIIAMAGASRAHNLINSAVHVALVNQLGERPCEVYQGDMRVHIATAKAYRYPDVAVVCGEPQFLENVTPDTLINPTLLVEVLSSSTLMTDKIHKLFEYRQLPSLREYVLIAQDSLHVEIYVRQADKPDAWIYSDVQGRDAHLYLPSVNCTLFLHEIYRKVGDDAL
jgi:Uma2 family endonuclease